LPWLVAAVVVWLFIIVFLRTRQLGKYWSAGVWALLLSYFLTRTFLEKGFFSFNNAMFSFQNMPLAFFVTTVGIGIIVIRFLPQEKVWQFPYLVLVTIILMVLENLILSWVHLASFNWSLYDSFLFKLLALIALAWLSGLTIKKRKTYFFR
jgi:hypothetical protein